MRRSSGPWSSLFAVTNESSRGVIAALPLLASLAIACGPSAADIEPGRETGACVEQACLGELVCLSDVCVDPSVALTTGADGGSATTDSGNPTADDSGDTVVPLTSVSILVVVDNSGTMGEEQARLPAAITTLADALTNAGIAWRIGVTTSDNGNPWCDGTGPEGGQLVASSCRSRTQDFVFAGAVPVDATAEACLTPCPAEWANIGLAPSADGVVHPWVENVQGATNLPAGLSVGDALGCIVPQGISGCGFEEQLESMNKAITRTQTEGEASLGFLPADALLAVVMVTDEADCSLNKAFETIFLPDGNRVFWSNPRDGAPTSAVCWNAGVTCSGSACSSADKNVDGGPAADPDTDAVLRPVSRYVDALQAPAASMFALIGGVDASGNAVYSDSPSDPAFVVDFGIGPGCEGPGGRAVPPVRMREVAEAFADGTQNTFSVCETSYVAAMEAYATAIITRMQSG